MVRPCVPWPPMRRIRTLVAGAALAAAFAACSSDAGGDRTAGDTAPAPASTSTPPAEPSPLELSPAEPPAAAPPGAAGGPTGEEAAVETVFLAYNAALVARDFATACSLNAPETNDALVRGVTAQGTPVGSCEEAFAAIYASPEQATAADLIASNSEVRDVTVAGATASVTWVAEVQGQSRTVTNQLRLIDGQWRLLATI